MTVARDKALHAAVGLALGLGANLLSGLPGVGTLVAALIGAGKEVWDRRKNKQALAKGEPPPHSVDTLDAVATVVGGLAGDVLGNVVHYIGGL